jgi:hypothetical protein
LLLNLRFSGDFEVFGPELSSIYCRPLTFFQFLAAVAFAPVGRFPPVFAGYAPVLALERHLAEMS